jgi:methylthioribose-1-phosphate isomerase
VIAPEGVKVYNPAFDATPLEYITDLITGRRVIFLPCGENVPKVLEAFL